MTCTTLPGILQVIIQYLYIVRIGYVNGISASIIKPALLYLDKISPRDINTITNTNTISEYLNSG